MWVYMVYMWVYMVYIIVVYVSILHVYVYTWYACEYIVGIVHKSMIMCIVLHI